MSKEADIFLEMLNTVSDEYRTTDEYTRTQAIIDSWKEDYCE